MSSFPLTGDRQPKIVKSLKDEEQVPMLFPGPADVRLALQNGDVMVFKPGVQLVPKSLVDHSWLKAHKVQIVPGAKPAVDMEEENNTKKKEELAKKAQKDADATRSQASSVLSAMKKEELIAHASTNHELELSPDMKKADMVNAILDATAKKEAGNAAGTGQE